MKEAAAGGGLLDYDKSATMNVKCKRDPMIVRAYTGLMDENPTLANAVTHAKRSCARPCTRGRCSGSRPVHRMSTRTLKP